LNSSKVKFLSSSSFFTQSGTLPLPVQVSLPLLYLIGILADILLSPIFCSAVTGKRSSKENLYSLRIPSILSIAWPLSSSLRRAICIRKSSICFSISGIEGLFIRRSVFLLCDMLNSIVIQALNRWDGCRPPQTTLRCANIVLLTATRWRGRHNEGYDDWCGFGKERFPGPWRLNDGAGKVS